MVNWWDLAYWIYAPWDTDKPPRELVELVEEGRVEPCRALDVGCGTGSYVIYLASKGFEAVGIDISPAAIRKARAKAVKRNVDCRFHVVDFLNAKGLSSVIKEPFDLVMDYGCLHSLKKQDRRRYPSPLKYVTHPRSLYILWAFHPGSTFFGKTRASVDLEEVRELFSHDFKILEERVATREKMIYIMERK
ncbi:MAG: class I SAM-dependent methyltransferase [Candidatus Geothermarchaeales archaeon]